MIRCRIRWATKWCVLFFGNSFLSQVFSQNTEISMKSYRLKKHYFLTFSLPYMIEEKCHIHSFVEQMKLYRLVYNSIKNIKNCKEKYSQI
jgi:hypothetical protein